MPWKKRARPPKQCRMPSFVLRGAGSVWICPDCGREWELKDSYAGRYFVPVNGVNDTRCDESRRFPFAWEW